MWCEDKDKRRTFLIPRRVRIQLKNHDSVLLLLKHFELNFSFKIQDFIPLKKIEWDPLEEKTKVKKI